MECSCHSHASSSNTIDNPDMTSSNTSFSIDNDHDTPTTSSSSPYSAVRLKRVRKSRRADDEILISARRSIVSRSSSSRTFSISSLFLILLYFVGTVDCLKCYCTEDHCLPFGACEGPVCMVGILRENNQVIRTCGARAPGCHRDEDEKWTDLCACDQPFCNTFSYLRMHTRRESTPPEDEPLVFQRVDRPDDGWMPSQDAPLSTRTSLLTLLLVVVPLTVGAATIMVVAFNYYCHLC